ncbi:MAG TPA: carboxypeptidase regulatory-like domain-containing protein [Vicinamibacterales bacterium]|nr:carboxypeptidase regulatory-like domain-containing protein [Vicinamibacterales bacterium]
MVEATPATPSAAPARLVRFTVLEAFRGVRSSEVEISTGRGGADCGYRFRPGVEYVVYAVRRGDSQRLAVSSCSRTRPADDAAADLSYARAIASGAQPAGRVSGQVVLARRRLDGGRVPPPRPLKGITVALDGGGRTLRASSDSFGAFEFDDLAAGSYTVDVELPDGYYVVDCPRQIQLPDERGCLDVGIAAYDDGRVTGRVVDERSRPIAGLTVDLTLAGRLNARAARMQTVTRADGSYQFSRVPPGRYVIGINTQSTATASEPRVFHPGVRYLAAATVVSLAGGERRTLSDLVMPAGVQFVAIAGIVLDPDGYFAADARVFLAGPDSGDPVLASPVVTDGSGRFTIAAPAGREYRVFAERTRPGGPGSHVDSSDPVRIRAVRDALPLRLALELRY